MTNPLEHIMVVMDGAFDPDFGEAWNRKQVADALAMPNTYYLLAGPGGKPHRGEEEVTGFTLSRGAAGEEELLLIAVGPEHRGQGIGGALLERFIEEARSRGANRLFLEMREGNPAARLYRRYGFEQVGRRRAYYHSGRSGPIDALTFARQPSAE